MKLISEKMVMFEEMQKIVTVCNLGGFSNLEFTNICFLVLENINSRTGLKNTVVRFGSGALMTSLDMKGINVSVCEVQKKEQLEWFDSVHEIPAWPVYSEPVEFVGVELSCSENTKTELKVSENAVYHLKKIGQCLRDIEDKVNDLDRISADGDCGSTFARLGGVLLADLTIESNEQVSRIQEFLKIVTWFSDACGDVMGGSSGGLLSIGLKSVLNDNKLKEFGHFNHLFFARVIETVARSIAKYGGAKPGQKTLLDVLGPMVESLRHFDLTFGKSIVQVLAESSEIATEKTREMIPLAGRAAYTGRKSDGVDPGCYVFAAVLKKVSETEK